MLKDYVSMLLAFETHAKDLFWYDLHKMYPGLLSLMGGNYALAIILLKNCFCVGLH